ncbi:acetoacetate--CoA ligase [Nocardia otitidiscaviarum]|uniref:Acetoacetate--CoA ligase n=5 Tax=Nocardia otitidiscaviarum TaxID=1823 RepID=A0A516NWQ8_9NOCA|nr:acetoacetate--CoA ligase [Nocardia otitidiscaviarum]QDP83349.1 acetoacetate--CoA ligase [Nocardia otitidiscaviarum]
MDTAVAQWTPSDTDIEAARITDFARFVTARTGMDLPDYRSLWQWSVDDITGFWRAVWDYFDLGPAPGAVLTDAAMPGARWFPEVRLNYVDQVVRQARTDRPAILDIGEDAPVRELSWAELLTRTGAFARTLRAQGVQAGDRVAGYLPNIPEAVIAFLATASIGAIWSACGQDYSPQAALDRLGQLEPVVLVTADGYRYGGKEYDRRAEIASIRAGLPTVRATVAVSRLGHAVPGAVPWADASAGGTTEFATESVAFDHPLWVLYSSGTTGKPKGIVHGHGGVLLEHLKAIALHTDLGPTDTFFWYTSPSWMMWNFQIAGLLVGATIVCYDGSPTHPTTDTLWTLAATTATTVLGTSPGYVLACAKADTHPARDHDLTALRSIGITGSALPPSSSLWLRDHIGDLPVTSISGGTDVVSAFLGAVPTVPVWPGELSVPYLGAAVAAYDDHGHPVHGEVGELVITAPMPSMPVRFWNDPDHTRYHHAYFDTYPGIWRHGDWITITDHDSIIVHGRSDSTLNRNGIRMGSADIYQAVEALPEITESLVLGIEQPDGGYWMPLFVVLTDGTHLDDRLRERIATAIRTELSPRHVPDEIIAAPGIPHTRTGKKLEVPLKKLLRGADPDTVVARTAIDDPALLDWFAAIRRYAR